MSKYCLFRSWSKLTFVLLLSGCSVMPGTTAYDTQGKDFFYGVFADIPIPKEMNMCKVTDVVTGPNDLVTGSQVFTGRAEVNSLLQVMHIYLDRVGWTLRASTQGVRSFMIFEKPDRYCSIYIVDGQMFTELQLYVVPKLVASPGSQLDSSRNLPPGQGQRITPGVLPEHSPIATFDQRLSE